MKTFDLRADGSFADGSLWVRRVSLAPGEQYVMTSDHGDEAVFVRSGALSFEGRSVEAGGTAVIEGSAEASFTAGPDGAVLVHFGPRDTAQPTDGAYGPCSNGARGVHLVGPRGVVAIEQPGRTTRFFADSSCPTCRITLFSTARDEEFRSAAHSHSEDEILYVLDGWIQVGSSRLEPDTGVAIPGNEVYGFRSGPDGFRFLNYRRDVSTYRSPANKLEGLENPRAMPDAIVVDDLR